MVNLRYNPIQHNFIERARQADVEFPPITRLNDAVYEIYRPTSGEIDQDIVIFPGFEAENCTDAYLSELLHKREIIDGGNLPLDHSPYRGNISALPYFFPQARILLLSYAAVSAMAGTVDMSELTEHLAVSIVELAEVGTTCPVVLVGYDKGLVLKRVCITADQIGQECTLGLRARPYEVFSESVRRILFPRTKDPDGTDSREERMVESRLLQGDSSIRSLRAVLEDEAEQTNSEFEKRRRDYNWESRHEYDAVWKARNMTLGLDEEEIFEFLSGGHMTLGLDEEEIFFPLWEEEDEFLPGSPPEADFSRLLPLRVEPVEHQTIPLRPEEEEEDKFLSPSAPEADFSRHICRPEEEEDEFLPGSAPEAGFSRHICGLLPLRVEPVEHQTIPLRPQEEEEEEFLPGGPPKFGFSRIQRLETLRVDPVEHRTIPLRPDAVALGFDGFECKFDPHNTICLCRSKPADDFVKLIFFHPEGMAQLVGVGIRFSEVLLWEDPDRVVEVTEIEEAEWKRYWTSTDSPLIVFQRESARTETLTPGDWIGRIVKLLRGSPLQVVNPKRETAENGIYTEPKAASSSSCINRLQSTTKVRLGPSKMKLGVPIASDQKPKSRLSGLSKFSARDSAVADDTVTIHSRTYELEAEIAIDFSSGVGDNGRFTPNTFKSTLEVGFNMPEVGMEQSRQDFGWYQDELLVCFKCAQERVVTKTTKREEEIASGHQSRDVQRETHMETMCSNEREIILHSNVGVSTPVNASVSADYRKGKATTTTKTLQVRNDMIILKLSDVDFAITYRGACSKLAYQFVHDPAVESFNIWTNPEDRERLSRGVIRSNIPIGVTAGWKVTDGVDAEKDGIFEYEFSCQRTLSVRRKLLVRSKFRKPREFFPPPDVKSHEMSKKLFINHGFSHIQRLKIPTAGEAEIPHVYGLEPYCVTVIQC
ncbi:hypothetical protein R1sor_012533 [Riccia sorocarpa]|uniref:Uncharacterized protein n=1 Tax=Riccia sorocarpa TaxID=122646 RepID=A0ABD3I825_9MARC